MSILCIYPPPQTSNHLTDQQWHHLHRKPWIIQAERLCGCGFVIAQRVVINVAISLFLIISHFKQFNGNGSLKTRSEEIKQWVWRQRPLQLTLVSAYPTIPNKLKMEQQRSCIPKDTKGIWVNSFCCYVSGRKRSSVRKAKQIKQ